MIEQTSHFNCSKLKKQDAFQEVIRHTLPTCCEENHIVFESSFIYCNILYYVNAIFRAETALASCPDFSCLKARKLLFRVESLMLVL